MGRAGWLMSAACGFLGCMIHPEMTRRSFADYDPTSGVT